MSASIGLDVSALDPEFKNHAARGIGRYVRELKSYLDAHPTTEPQVGYFNFREVQGPPWIEKGIARLPAGKMTVRQQIVYPLALRRAVSGRFSALHYPAHMDAPSWSGVPYALTVLDLIPLIFRDLYAPEVASWRFRLARWLEIRAIRNARMIFAISECTARDVQRVLGIPADRIVVTPLGVNGAVVEVQEPDGHVATEIGIAPEVPFLLYVGGIDPRKNWQLLLKSIQELRRRAEMAQRPLPVLVLAGRIEADRQYPLLMKEIEARGLDRAIIRLGFVEDSRLQRLYRACACFIFPSLYEGFGLPPLEAMAAGAPVVSSNASSMPEVLGDAGVLVDPADECSFIEAIEAFLLSDSRRREFRARGVQQARRFTWQETGRKTVQGYRELIQRL
jgi:glycosyltransferase involved in cell wall biosynthesis